LPHYVFAVSANRQIARLGTALGT